jgi:hypothetical protein
MQKTIKPMIYATTLLMVVTLVLLFIDPDAIKLVCFVIQSLILASQFWQLRWYKRHGGEL